MSSFTNDVIPVKSHFIFRFDACQESFGDTGEELEAERFTYTLALCAATVGLLEVFFFLLATLLRLHKVKDVAGGCAFIVLALLSLVLNNHHDLKAVPLRQGLATLCVCVWALRLAAYLLFRHVCMGQDKYSAGQPSSCCKHIGYWTFQAVWVFVVSLPVMAINSSTQLNRLPLWTNWDIAGTSIFGAGMLFELIADQQKLNWKRNPLNHSKWCTFGLWRWSRHPNYLCEMLVWWGVWVLGAPWLQGVQHVALLSPLFVIFILLFVSGIPVVEAAADAKYGKLAEYRAYKRGTSVLLPILPWLYKRLPRALTQTLLLDFPCYNFLPEDLKSDLDDDRQPAHPALL